MFFIDLYRVNMKKIFLPETTGWVLKHGKMFLPETTCLVLIKLSRNDHYMVLFNNCSNVSFL